MRVDDDAGALSLRTRHRMGRAAAGRRQPETHVDKQPAGRMPRGSDQLGVALLAANVPARSTGVPKFGDALSHQRLKQCGVLIHDLSSSSQDLLWQDYLSQELLSRASLERGRL